MCIYTIAIFFSALEEIVYFVQHQWQIVKYRGVFLSLNKTVVEMEKFIFVQYLAISWVKLTHM